MKTQIELALSGKITPEMRSVSSNEKVDPELVRKYVASGLIVIPKNRSRELQKIIGIGKGLRTKVNANIGTSPDSASINEELEKLGAAVRAGTDSVMDLSTGGDLGKIRRKILANCSIPVGTVPIYQAAVETACHKNGVVNMDADLIFEKTEEHAMDGVDFMTVHCGVTLKSLDALKKTGRVMGIVSRGGSFLAAWMLHNKLENPLYSQFDRLLEIAKKYDATLSLGDGLRPGCLADANDPAQMMETRILGKLAQRARLEGVQVMIEGPGHTPLHMIKENVKFQKKVCSGAPYYVLGPLVTDVAPGYDHITSAIGGAFAAWQGADFLCCVTPSEHLSLPSPKDVFDGVIASRIAAHSADIAKGLDDAGWDLRLSKCRFKRDWKSMNALSMDPEKAREYRRKSRPGAEDVCTMCGKYCAMKQAGLFFRKK